LQSRKEKRPLTLCRLLQMMMKALLAASAKLVVFT
jgi:hypothetical protein